MPLVPSASCGPLKFERWTPCPALGHAHISGKPSRNKDLEDAWKSGRLARDDLSKAQDPCGFRRVSRNRRDNKMRALCASPRCPAGSDLQSWVGGSPTSESEIQGYRISRKDHAVPGTIGDIASPRRPPLGPRGSAVCRRIHDVKYRPTPPRLEARRARLPRFGQIPSVGTNEEHVNRISCAPATEAAPTFTPPGRVPSGHRCVCASRGLPHHVKSCGRKATTKGIIAGNE